MKWIIGLLLFLCAYVSFFVWLYFNDQKNWHVEKQYCGIIVEKGKEDPTSGYKSRTDAKYFLIFIDRDCKKYIRVECVVNDWYAFKVGQTICYTLDQSDLKDYGNGSYHLK